MKRFGLEAAVGVFVLAGLLALGYLSIKLGKLEFLGNRGYTVSAAFPTVGGLKPGAVVEIAGVEVGRVLKIYLRDYQAVVVMRIDPHVQLQEDAIVSIRTKGLLGEKYVRITPGGSERVINPGGRLRETEPPIDLEEAIANFIFGKL